MLCVNPAKMWHALCYSIIPTCLLSFYDSNVGIFSTQMLAYEMSKYFRLDNIVYLTGSVPENGLYPIFKCCSSNNKPSW